MAKFEGQPRNKGKAILFSPSLGINWPGGDLVNRFGQGASVGGTIELISANNWIFGADGSYFFGAQVKDDPLAIIRTPEGDIIGNNMILASILYKQRGFYAGGMIGKLIVFNPDKRSGLRVTLSGGWTQHYIRLQDDSRNVPQIKLEYAPGYDRLTGGPAIAQFIGWQHLGRKRGMNFMIGLEFQQGFTQTLREWDFSERRKLDGQRTDLRFGLKGAWTLPLYLRKSSEIEY
ncbi:MAG: hypothetical protein IT269_11065 [Saprospiraceae bacterium]|nr:hypothetical protein [Saprospiraceae bacterium]